MIAVLTLTALVFSVERSASAMPAPPATPAAGGPVVAPSTAGSPASTSPSASPSLVIAPSPMPAQLGTPLATAESAPPPGALQLHEAVTMALSRNERARISDLNVVVADAAIERARAAFLPVISMNGSDTQRPSSTVRNGVTTEPSNIGTAAAQFNQPLLNASAFPLYAQAKDARDATVSQTIDDKRVLGFDAARAFFSVLTTQAVLEAAERATATASDNLADTQARVESGLTSSNDATRAQIDLANSARLVEVDKGNVQNAYTQLAFTLNVPSPTALAVPTDLLRASQQPIAPVETLVRLALQNRPDIDAHKLTATAAHDFAAEPLLRLVPTVGLSGQLNTSTNTAAGASAFDESLTVTGTWTLFDGGIRYADRRSRVASAKIADLNTVTLVRSVDAQVKTAVSSLGSAQAAFRVAQQSFDAARQSAEETEILYKQGLAKAIELVDANDTRLTAEVQYVSAQYTMAQAYLDLRQALGMSALLTANAPESSPSASESTK